MKDKESKSNTLINFLLQAQSPWRYCCLRGGIFAERSTLRPARSTCSLVCMPQGK